MIFCKKCSRILDEDLSQCPYCGNMEDEVKVETNHQEDSFNTQIDDIVPNQEILVEDSVKLGEQTVANFDVQPQNDLIDVDELDDMFGKTKEIEESAYESVKIEEPTPVLEPTPTQNNQYQSTYTPPVTDAQPLSIQLKILIIIGSICVPIGGLVGAIILMSKKDSVDRSFGIALLAIVLVEMFLLFFCCVFIMVLGSSV